MVTCQTLSRNCRGTRASSVGPGIVAEPQQEIQAVSDLWQCNRRGLLLGAAGLLGLGLQSGAKVCQEHDKRMTHLLLSTNPKIVMQIPHPTSCTAEPL